MFEEITINESEAITFLNQEESHFFDATRKQGDGRTLQKKAVAFANADGGEIFIGIIDKRDTTAPPGIFGRWDGFKEQEEANASIQNLIDIRPSLDSLYFEYYPVNVHPELGKVLKVTIQKSPKVHYTSDNKVYVRKGAQCLEITGDAILNLSLSKGATSYENQSVESYNLEGLYSAKPLNRFLQEYSPRTGPETFLKKQRLISGESGSEKPTYGSILLYDEVPSAALPKKCAVKITRYKTSDAEPTREHLERQETVEANLYDQIEQSIGIIQQMVESVPIMGAAGLEKAKYPPEAIKEILVNAIIHRDYNISDDVLVFIFNNRIEVHSPGGLPGHITKDNILQERFSRNPKIVRLLNKYPEPPNKDIGEGLNTAFQKMRAVRLKEPTIIVKDNRVIVILPHQTLATPEEQILEFLKHNHEINNKTAREITGIGSENQVKRCFIALSNRGIIERVPEKGGSKAAWRLKPHQAVV